MPNEKTSTAKTIFLSHSGKDIEKVRKIRNILEVLEYEPLLFHMKCLDDNNEVLEDFIKKEIDARNIFVYCRSENSEASVWVQKELEYIKSNSRKRLYEIDIEKPFGETLVCFLQTIAEIIKKNKVFISCSHMDRSISNVVTAVLEKNGYEVIRYNNICLNDNGEQMEQHERDIMSISKNGIFLPIITGNFLKSMYCMSEVEKVLYESERHDVIFKPICVGISPMLVQTRLPLAAQKYQMLLTNPLVMSSDDTGDLLSFLEADNAM